MDQHLAESVEGDNQAVRRIFEFLEVKTELEKVSILDGRRASLPGNGAEALRRMGGA